MSTENSITNNLKSPRRSSRKVKPVTANDFVTFKNISLYQNNGEKRTSLKSQINIPKRKVNIKFNIILSSIIGNCFVKTIYRYFNVIINFY